MGVLVTDRLRGVADHQSQGKISRSRARFLSYPSRVRSKSLRERAQDLSVRSRHLGLSLRQTSNSSWKPPVTSSKVLGLVRLAVHRQPLSSQGSAKGCEDQNRQGTAANRYKFRQRYTRQPKCQWRLNKKRPLLRVLAPDTTWLIRSQCINIFLILFLSQIQNRTTLRPHYSTATDFQAWCLNA